MKRILVIDESEVIRETLALILGREFAVVKRPPSSTGLPFADVKEQVDLLILGLTPQWGSETSTLVELVSRLPFGVLFLVDSKSIARTMVERTQFGCLTKPFNPYELQDKVSELLARRVVHSPRASTFSVFQGEETLASYLDYPYVTRSNAVLAQRFAVTQLPILIGGEPGCGQNQVALAMYRIHESPGLRFKIQAPSVTAGLIEQKMFELSAIGTTLATSLTLTIENLDKAAPDAQALLIEFLEQKEEKFSGARLLSTANADLLEKVYRGEFLDSLYYKVATLTLKLPPLRDRRDDIHVLADWFAQIYARRLGLGECVFSSGAKARLADYLWFGNVSEFETVVARTLALHRKPRIEAADLVFDFGVGMAVAEDQSGDFAEFIPRKQGLQLTPMSAETTKQKPAGNGDENTRMPDLNVVIHELAHEFKNPMVTIKTFAQLLGDRYDDGNFRARFQEVVGSDVERMDDLLEVMIEFADFADPRTDFVALNEKLQAVIGEIADECAKRQIRIQLTGNEKTCQIRADEAQLVYILKNVLLAVIMQAKMGTDIDIHIRPAANVVVSYCREEARLPSIAHYLTGSAGYTNSNILPLRMLLAKQLIERNGGRLVLHGLETEAETIRMEFSVT